MRREVQLKPGYAERYPSLMPGRWYAAAAVAGSIKFVVTDENSGDADPSPRLLDPEHFFFRGGSSRSGAWAGLRTRLRDRHTDLSTL